MTNTEWIIEINKIVLLTIFIVLVSISQIKISKQLDRLIELNQPEAIQLIIPDKPLLEDK